MNSIRLWKSDCHSDFFCRHLPATGRASSILADALVESFVKKFPWEFSADPRRSPHDHLLFAHSQATTHSNYGLIRSCTSVYGNSVFPYLASSQVKNRESISDPCSTFHYKTILPTVVHRLSAYTFAVLVFVFNPILRSIFLYFTVNWNLSTFSCGNLPYNTIQSEYEHKPDEGKNKCLNKVVVKKGWPLGKQIRKIQTWVIFPGRGHCRFHWCRNQSGLMFIIRTEQKVVLGCF